MHRSLLRSDTQKCHENNVMKKKLNIQKVLKLYSYAYRLVLKEHIHRVL